jgi:hypothetical protein
MSKNLTMKLRLGWGAEGAVAFTSIPGGVPKPLTLTPSGDKTLARRTTRQGLFFASEELGLKTARDRITIYGPKADGTYIVEFRAGRGRRFRGFAECEVT